jgi:pyridoxine 5-phosphate synthase
VARLLINIDHIGTLRNARRERFPDPVHAAAICEAAGAHGIVFHLREDRRHITDRDVRLLKETVRGKLDFELSTDPEIVGICCEIAPHLATLVPERREEITTESGLDVCRGASSLRDVTRRLFDAGVEEVAFFIDADLRQIDAARQAGANAVEFHTGDYAEAHSRQAREAQLKKLAAATTHAHSLGLRVHAGHGLDYNNTAEFLARVPHVEEVSIGFAIVARAVLVGLDRAVRDMNAIVGSNSQVIQ